MSTEASTMFEPVADNAVDFLARSLRELETAPKYSVIHFCSAIELFLKARLMLEHWALIDEDPKTANRAQFLSGSFKSTTMKGTIERLQNIANVRIAPEAQRSFSEVRKHRNKMVHFFHPDYAEASERTIETIVIEQARAWFYLHRLLTKDWKAQFANYQDRISDLHQIVSNNRDYLKAKYEALLPGIQKGHEKGTEFFSCDFCKFPAVRRRELLPNLFTAECLVCESRSNLLKEVCPDCGEDIYIYDLGEAYCEKCDKFVGLDYFLDKYAPITHIEKDLYEENRAYCSLCEFTEEPSVVPFHNELLCLCCLQQHSEIGACEWCGAIVAGDTEDTYVHGCRIWCHGYIGHHADD